MRKSLLWCHATKRNLLQQGRQKAVQGMVWDVAFIDAVKLWDSSQDLLARAWKQRTLEDKFVCHYA